MSETYKFELYGEMNCRGQRRKDSHVGELTVEDINRAVEANIRRNDTTSSDVERDAAYNEFDCYLDGSVLLAAIAGTGNFCGTEPKVFSTEPTGVIALTLNILETLDCTTQEDDQLKTWVLNKLKHHFANGGLMFESCSDEWQGWGWTDAPEHVLVELLKCS
jgi:hypothetical protein